MIFSWALVISGSFVLSLSTVALLLKVSRRMGWYDRTGGRKIHTGNIPRLGGIGFIFSSAVFSVVCFRLRGAAPALRSLPLAPAFALIVISGVRDDFKPLAPRWKLAFQTAAAFCALLSGCAFESFLYIDRVDLLSLSGWELFRYPLAFLWIVGVTNAVNFIDGVDGLAGGVSLLAVLSFGAISVSLGGGGEGFLPYAGLAAAVLGFLAFNAPFPRAKIFMGDGGAYFLGFALALMPLGGNGGVRLPVLYAAAVLQIPILDTAAAVWRRLREGRRIDSSDRAHTHHKLMNLGLSSRRIDAVLVTLQLCLSVLVYAAVKTAGYLSLIMMLLAYALGMGFFVALHFLNRRALSVVAGGAGAAAISGKRAGLPVGTLHEDAGLPKASSAYHRG
jgi:UDP-GlcNAc:undecaprenyl-phosphate GlcNAc-1-phosphate transferase